MEPRGIKESKSLRGFRVSKKSGNARHPGEQFFIETSRKSRSTRLGNEGVALVGILIVSRTGKIYTFSHSLLVTKAMDEYKQPDAVVSGYEDMAYVMLCRGRAGGFERYCRL